VADRFHLPELGRSGDLVSLEGQEAKHLAQVLRAIPGTAVELFDGRGGIATGTVLHVEKRSVEIRLDEVRFEPEPDLPLLVASCLPKGDRAEFLIEKLTELGIHRLIPLVSRRSVAQLSESRREKFERLTLESCKQCRRSRALMIAPETSFDRLLEDPALSPFQRWLFDPAGEPFASSRPPADNDRSPADRAATSGRIIAIGPEGGWDPEELSRARHRGWVVRRLPTPILRIETAALAAATMLALGIADS
jgi:16S rRNA (uracil1498-N3)-methyltransferase